MFFVIFFFNDTATTEIYTYLHTLSPHDALPISVGKPLIGDIHILDEEGNELPPGEAGTIYFGGGPPYEYHNAPDKTESSKDPKGHGWTTLGDVGYLDEDDWLFLKIGRA